MSHKRRKLTRYAHYTLKGKGKQSLQAIYYTNHIVRKLNKAMGQLLMQYARLTKGKNGARIENIT